jgi:hypothetical protein
VAFGSPTHLLVSISDRWISKSNTPSFSSNAASILPNRSYKNIENCESIHSEVESQEVPLLQTFLQSMTFVRVQMDTA